MKTAVIVGGGFSGCVMAQMLTEKGFKCTVIEAGPFLGGGCHTFFYNGHPYTIGPRHVLIPNDKMFIWDYMSRFLTLRELQHHSLTYVEQDQRFYTYPIHEDEIETMPDRDKIRAELASKGDVSQSKDFEEYWVNSVGQTLYDKFVNTYSKKMWGLRNNKEIDDFGFSPKGVALKSGSKVCFEGSRVIAYPTEHDGFNSFFQRCVEGCRVIQNTPVRRFDLENKRVLAGEEWISGDVVINTASLDLVFDYCYGEQRYIGRDFIKVILPCERVTPDPYYFLYYAGNEPFTRVVEYKLLTGYKSPDTLIGIEFPSDKNKLYPYPVKADIAQAARYMELFPKDCYTIGRMGKYHYDNMAVVIEDAFELMKRV